MTTNGPQKLCKRAGKNLKRRFKLALLEEEYINRMKRIRNINEDLDKLVNGARQSATNLSTSRANLSAIENHYKLLRDGAQYMCDALKQRIQVPHDCARDHSVSLCLDMRSAPTKRRGGRRHDLDTSIRRKSALNFRLWFCLAGAFQLPAVPPVTWKELEVEPILGTDDESEGEQQHAESHHRDEPSQASERSAMPTKKVGFATKVVTKALNYFGGAGQPDPSVPEDHPISTMTAHDNVGPSPQPIATPQIIHNICETIKRSIKTTERQSLGFLTSGCEKMKYQLWSLPISGGFGLADNVQCSHEWRPEPVSLLALLQDDNSNGHGYPIMKLQDRLSLGIKLASSVIQLCQTPWLSESWSKRDIVFFANPHPLIDNPMVLHNLSSPQLGRTQQPGIVRRSKLLFSLGVLLWELWFWRRLEDDPDLRACLDHGQLLDSKLYVIAGAAYQKLDGDAPLKYCDAVRVCFFDNIPTGGQGFSTTVWQKVICLLEENYSAYAHA